MSETVQVIKTTLRHPGNVPRDTPEIEHLIPDLGMTAHVGKLKLKTGRNQKKMVKKKKISETIPSQKP